MHFKEPYNPKYELAEGLEYSVRDDGTCSITGIGTCELTEFSIPEEIDGYRVTGISGYAFIDCSNLTCIEIPKGVTYIGDLAFSGCSSLININIPSSVTSIGENVFFNCNSLTSIKVSSGSYAETWAQDNGFDDKIE